MARVMSLSFVVFLAVPIVAPSIGQVILVFGTWPTIFEVLAIIGAAVAVWVALRLPETLHPEDRTPISPAPVLGSFRTVLTNRMAIGYMLAMSLVTGGLFGLINPAPPVIHIGTASCRERVCLNGYI